MQIVTPVGAVRVYSAVIGKHNVPYMLAAVAVALAASYDRALQGRSITLAVRLEGAGCCSWSASHDNDLQGRTIALLGCCIEGPGIRDRWTTT